MQKKYNKIVVKYVVIPASRHNLVVFLKQNILIHLTSKVPTYTLKAGVKEVHHWAYFFFIQGAQIFNLFKID